MPEIPEYRRAAEEYHADREYLSSSMLKTFRESPALFHGRYITGKWQQKTTPDLEFGSLFDWILLREGPVGCGFRRVPPEVLTSNGHRRGQAWNEFQAAPENQGVYLAGENAEAMQIECMIDAVREHDAARRLIEGPGQFQRIYKWTDENGVNRKVMLDKSAAISGQYLIVDLKTAKDATPSGFAKAMANFGYHNQAAFYQDAVEHEHDVRPDVVLIVVCKVPPYRVGVYQIADDAIEEGRKQNAKALAEYKRCLDDNDWNELDHGEIHTLDLPSWAYSQSEQWSL